MSFIMIVMHVHFTLAGPEKRWTPCHACMDPITGLGPKIKLKEAEAACSCFNDNTCRCPVGYPKIKLVRSSYDVGIDDVPFRIVAPRGPAFDFHIQHSTGFDRSLTNFSWSLGDRWAHRFERYIEVTNSVYKMRDATGHGPEFGWNGTNFTDQSTSAAGTYILEWDGSNIVAHSMFPDISGSRSRGGCASCGAADNNPSVDRPPCQAYHTAAGYVFEPVDTNIWYRLHKIIGSDGAEMVFYYGSNNSITSVVDAVGNTFTFHYSSSNLLTNVTHQGGRSMALTYANGQVESITDMAGNTASFSYDAQNRITALATLDDSGTSTNTTTVSYGPGTVTVSYPDGNEEYVVWSTHGYRASDPIGVTEITWSVNDYSWEQQFRDETSGDGFGKSVSIISYIEDSTTSSESYYWYDYGTGYTEKKLCKTYTDREGITYSFTYNGDGDLTNVVTSASPISRVSSAEIVYFEDTTYPHYVTNIVKDGEGVLISKSAKEYSRYDNGTTNDLYDDIITLVSLKSWVGDSSYTETRYVYDTNTWLMTEVQELVQPGTYRTVKTFSHNTNSQVVATTDQFTNTVHYTYDSLYRLSTTTETNSGIAVVYAYTYDNLDRVTNVVLPCALTESWTYAFDGSGVRSFTDRGGNVTTNDYDGNGWLKQSVTWSTNGIQLSYVEYQHDAMGNVTNTLDTLGNRRLSLRDAAGRLSQSIDPNGNMTRYLCDEKTHQYMTIYPDGNVSSNTYDSLGRIVKTARYASTNSSEVLTSTEHTYDNAGRRSTTIDALGNVTSNTYDFAGRIVKLTYPDGTYTEMQYDLLGNVTNQVDQLGNSTVNTYDYADRLVSSTDPEGRTTTYEYDTDWPNQVKYMVNANNVTNQENYYHPYTGKLLTNIVNGLKTVYEYDNLAQVVKTIYPDSSYARSIYDGTRLIQTVSRTGNTTSFAFDAAGRRTAVTNSLGKVTQFFFDAASNVTNVLDALTNSTVSTYDSMNRLTVTTLPDSRNSTNAYDSLGRLVSRTGAGSVPVSYEYNALGQMIKLINGEGNETEFSYNSMGRLTQKTYADNSYYQYQYNAAGWLTNRVDAKSQSTKYSYNDVGQLTGVDYPADTDISYTFDTIGRVTQRADTAGTWTWTYQGQSSRVLTEATPYSQTVTYTYNTNGMYELASASLDATHKTEYSWCQGRLTNVSWTVGALVSSVQYAYKSNSDLLKTTTYLGGTAMVHRTYDDINRLLLLSATNAAGTINSFTYTLDSTGRRTQRTDADSSSLSWGYDSYDQLTSASKTNSANGAADAAYNYRYQYDLVGNRRHEDRGQLDLDGTFNVLNQLTYRDWSGKLDVYGSVSSTNAYVIVGGVTNAPPFYNVTNWLGGGAVDNAGSNNIPVVANVGTNSTQTNITVYMPPAKPQQFQWDANGNLTNDGWRAYFWNNENRLIAIEKKLGAETDYRRVEFVYDGQGRRAEKNTFLWNTGKDEWKSNPADETHYVWDGWNLLAELDKNNAIESYHAWGLDLSQSLQGAGGIGGLLSRVENSVDHLYTFDGNGNVKDVLDGSGNVIAHYDYDPFGRTVASSGTYADDNPWRFSTKQFDDNWRFYYYGYRIYLPEYGFWPSRDPIWEKIVLNLYSAMMNDPVRFIDPDGKEPTVLGEENAESPDDPYGCKTLHPWNSKTPVKIGDTGWCPKCGGSKVTDEGKKLPKPVQDCILAHEKEHEKHCKSFTLAQRCCTLCYWFGSEYLASYKTIQCIDKKLLSSGLSDLEKKHLQCYKRHSKKSMKSSIKSKVEACK